jgi:hypothetical protein
LGNREHHGWERGRHRPAYAAVPPRTAVKLRLTVTFTQIKKASKLSFDADKIKSCPR